MRVGRWVVDAALMALATVALFAPALLPAAADSSVPYTDPAANGIIALCNQAGQHITSGSVSDKPFAWTALSSTSAPPPYDGSGRTATLYAYQPRPGVPPGLWSGFQMTAASRYTNPTHPSIQSTQRDFSLADLIAAYPPMLDGFYQLRMLLGAPNEPTFRLGYPATDIKVTGNTWAVVRGGEVPCNAGSATSAEALLPPGTYTSPDAPTPSSGGGRAESPGGASGTGQPRTTASGSGGAPASPGGAGSAATPGSQATAAAPTGNSVDSKGNAGAVIAVGVALLGLAAAGGLLWRYRRRQSSGRASG